LLNAYTQEIPVDFSALSKAMREYIKEFKGLNELAVSGANIVEELLDEFRKEQRDEQKERQLGIESDAIKNQLTKRLTGVLDQIVATHSSANGYLLNRSLNLREDHLEKDVKRYRILERLVIYYEGIKYAATGLAALFEDVLAKIEAAEKDTKAA
jgi:hypothetical protein